MVDRRRAVILQGAGFRVSSSNPWALLSKILRIFCNNNSVVVVIATTVIVRSRNNKNGTNHDSSTSSNNKKNEINKKIRDA